MRACPGKFGGSFGRTSQLTIQEVLLPGKSSAYDRNSVVHLLASGSSRRILAAEDVAWGNPPLDMAARLVLEDCKESVGSSVGEQVATHLEYQLLPRLACA